MSAHRKIHSKLFPCEICGKSVKHKKDHMKTMHSSKLSEEKHYCDICGKSFVREVNMKNHKQNFHEGRRFECKYCPSIFSGQGALQEHQSSVHEGKRYDCDQCDKSFTRKPKLMEHIEGALGQHDA